MANNINKIAKSLKKSIKTEKGTKAYDTAATVTRIEGKTAWVHIPGGVDETPVKLTMNAKKGETVQVRVSGGKAWLTGNASAPPTDDTTANKAQTTATAAKYAADNATAEAVRAKDAADRAETSAQEAQTSAANALTSANEAKASATEANKQAISATNSANNALTQLSTVESVVDTLTWIAEHSAFEPSTDTSVVASKTYYYPCNQILTLTSGTTTTNGLTFVTDANAGTVTVSGTATASTVYAVGQPDATAGTDIWFSGVNGGSSSTYQLRYSNGPGSTSINSGVGLGTIRSSGNLAINIFVASGYTANDVVFTPRVSTANEDFDYEIIESPTGNPSTQGYFELNTEEAVKTYVQTHLALTDEGLWLLPAASGTNKVLIATGAGSTYTTAGTYIIGSSGETLAKFSTNGLSVTTKKNNNIVEIANLGYGLGNAESGTAEAPYYTLGIRKSGEAVGNYSVAEGNGTTASALGSHAEGGNINVSGVWYYLTASGTYAHAEGCATTASGRHSHSEGYLTTASGDWSHAQNRHTIADQSSQTAIGKYNTANINNNLFVIGNGTADDSRSNAFTVDTSGNVGVAGDVNIASGKHYKINGTNLSASDVGAVPTSRTVNNKALSSNITLSASDVGALATTGGTLSGTLTLSSHSSAIGTVKQAYAAAKSVSSGTNTNLTSLSLEAGTWVVTGGVRFPNNATGYRRMNITTTSAAVNADVQLPALSGASTQLAYTLIVSPTSTTTYYLNCYHNAGTALSLVAGGGENGVNFIRAVRIA